MAPVTKKTAVLKVAGAKFDHAYATRNAAPRAGRSPSRRALTFSENPGSSTFSLTPQVWQKQTGRTNYPRPILLGSTGHIRTLTLWFSSRAESRRRRRKGHGQEGAIRAGDLLLG